MKKTISIVIVSIAALLIMFLGYIIIKYASLEPMKAIEFLSFIVSFGFVMLVIWAIDNLRKMKK